MNTKKDIIKYLEENKIIFKKNMRKNVLLKLVEEHKNNKIKIKKEVKEIIINIIDKTTEKQNKKNQTKKINYNDYYKKRNNDNHKKFQLKYYKNRIDTCGNIKMKEMYLNVYNKLLKM